MKTFFLIFLGAALGVAIEEIIKRWLKKHEQ